MKPGIETLLEKHFDWLSGHRTGLVSHQAATASDGTTTAEVLREALGSRLAALFGPEHGFYGMAGAGELTSMVRHHRWDIPIYSLYGKHRRPSAAMLANLDLLVVDFRDISTRCYTYLSTLRRVLEAAAEYGIGVVVADRAIPAPNVVDGPRLEASWRSFVADAPLPLVYGMTQGESAGWLKQTLGLELELKVAACSAWQDRSALACDTVEWIPPSPAIRSPDCARAYAATVFTEAFPELDCGRHDALAFRLIGAEWLDAGKLCDAMNEEELPGVSFHLHQHRIAKGAREGLELEAVRFSITNPDTFKPVVVSVMLMDHIARQTGREVFWEEKCALPEFFDKLYGSPKTRIALKSGAKGREVAAGWQNYLAEFESQRQKVLLY